jgi:hypothetical protein
MDSKKEKYIHGTDYPVYCENDKREKFIIALKNIKTTTEDPGTSRHEFLDAKLYQRGSR